MKAIKSMRKILDVPGRYVMNMLPSTRKMLGGQKKWTVS